MWNRYDDEEQEKILKKYDVILTNHKTRKERAYSILKKFNKRNLDKGMDKFNKGVDSFSSALKQIHIDESAIDPIEGTWGKKKSLPDATGIMWGRKAKPAGRRRAKPREPNYREQFWGKG